MASMATLLARVQNPTALTTGQFADLFGDHEFDGQASNDEMHAFWYAALRCIQGSTKSLDRVVALNKLGELTDVQQSQHFPKLNVRICLYQLILRLLKAQRVNQEKFGICGPAHFVTMLIKTKPLTYVGMAIGLLKNGSTKGDDGFEIKPDKHVADFDPTGNIPQADWLLAASLRNADTPIPPGKEMGEYGGTRAPDVFAYCVHAGYEKAIALACYEYTADWLLHWAKSNFYEQYHPGSTKSDVPGEFSNPFDPVQNVKIAAALLAQGWRILLKVNSSWIGFKPDPVFATKAAQGDKFAQNRLRLEKEGVIQDMQKQQSFLGGMIGAPSADHWVLAKEINFASDQISLVVFTWGSKYSTFSVDLTTFAKAYSGFVAARG